LAYKEEFMTDKTQYHRLHIRLPIELMKLMEKKMPQGITKNSWIITAVDEKIKRDVK
jgi:hypothetical protein